MISRELTAASAKPIVLAILDRETSYGYEIIQKVRDLSDDKIQWAEGALYPVLHRLERQGLVKSEWQKTDSGRRRKYYSITRDGQDELRHESVQWNITVDVLGKLGGLQHV